MNKLTEQLNYSSEFNFSVRVSIMLLCLVLTIVTSAIAESPQQTLVKHVRVYWVENGVDKASHFLGPSTELEIHRDVGTQVNIRITRVAEGPSSVTYHYSDFALGADDKVLNIPAHLIP